MALTIGALVVSDGIHSVMYAIQNVRSLTALSIGSSVLANRLPVNRLIAPGGTFPVSFNNKATASRMLEPVCVQKGRTLGSQRQLALGTKRFLGSPRVHHVQIGQKDHGCI